MNAGPKATQTSRTCTTAPNSCVRPRPTAPWQNSKRSSMRNPRRRNGGSVHTSRSSSCSSSWCGAPRLSSPVRLHPRSPWPQAALPLSLARRLPLYSGELNSPLPPCPRTGSIAGADASVPIPSYLHQGEARRGRAGPALRHHTSAVRLCRALSHATTAKNPSTPSSTMFLPRTRWPATGRFSLSLAGTHSLFLFTRHRAAPVLLRVISSKSSTPLPWDRSKMPRTSGSGSRRT